MEIREATVGELAYLRSEGQASRLALAGTENPPIVFQCVINQAFTTHDRVSEFLYDTATGDYTDVLPGMTVWIGSSAGHYDYGQGRIRKSATVDTIYIGLESEINLANDRHVTVIDEMGIWAKPPYTDPADDALRMDRDVEYSDQHTAFDPVPIMGPDAVLDVSSYPATLRFPGGSDSWVFGGSIDTWAWTATAGTLTDEDTNDPLLTINSYPTDGLIRVACTVTADNAKSFTGYRYVHIYDATHRPFTDFKASSIGGDLDSGAWSFSVTMQDNATRAEIRDRAKLILFRTDWYGETKTSLGQVEGRENVECYGWVDGESIDYDPLTGSVTFTVLGPVAWMKKLASIQPRLALATKEPSTWIEMPALNVDRFVWHMLHWRSTITAILDVRLSGDVKISAELYSPAAELGSQISDVAWSKIRAVLGANQYGMVYLFVHPQLVPEADRGWATVMTLETQDWENNINIRRKNKTAAQIAMNGKAFNASGSAKAYYSLSVGHIPRRYGRPELVEDLLVSDQAQANELCGLMSGQKNNQYEPIPVALASNNTMFTLFPAQYAQISVAPEDTVRGITATNLKLIPSTITRHWDEDNGVMTTEIEFEAATPADLATDGDVPEVIDPIDIVGPPIDNIDITPPIDIVILPPTDTNEDHPKVVIIAGSLGVFYTETFDKDSDDPDPDNRPEWIEMNEGLTEDEYTSIANLLVTPGGKIYVWSSYDSGSIHVAQGLGYPFTLIVTGDDLEDAGSYIRAIAVNPVEADQIVFTGGVEGTGDKFRLYMASSAGTYTEIASGINYKALPNQWIIYSHGYWLIFGSFNGLFSTTWLAIYEVDGTYVLDGSISLAVGQDFADRFAVNVGTSGVWYHWDSSGAAGYTKGDEQLPPGIVFDTTISPERVQGLAPSPTGTIIMGASGDTPYKSVDSGATWTSAAGTLPLGTDVWENCGDENRWIFGGGTAIRLTLDAGDTYFDKSGNLGYIAPLIDIAIIRFIE